MCLVNLSCHYKQIDKQRIRRREGDSTGCDIILKSLKKGHMNLCHVTSANGELVFVNCL